MPSRIPPAANPAEPMPAAEPVATSTRAEWHERLDGIPYVLPAVCVIVGVMSYPFLYSIYLSFQATPSTTTETHYTGLTNYAVVLQDSVFLNSLVTTVIWTIGCTVTDIVFGMGAAILVNQAR